MYKKFGISNELLNLAEEVEKELEVIYKEINKTCEYNSLKVLQAFQKYNLSEMHFNGTTGYGYDDIGRDTIEKIYADIFKSEDALVRTQFISGTHALTVSLFSILRPGDTMLSITGKPYDTLDEVIGIVDNKSSLKSFGIKYEQVELIADDFDYQKIKETLKNSKIKLIEIQRSRGYSTRKSISLHKVQKVIEYIKEIDPNVIIMVDNCYCEFVGEIEPIEIGADIAVGSLIKNLGGGITPNGAYIVGRKELIELAAQRLTAPGLGKEVGPSLGINKQILQGLFLAPQVVANSLKTAVFASKILEKLGYNVEPKYNDKRADIVQTIEFGDKEKLIRFCQGIQAASPIDSNSVPVPWDMPGYTDQVIMAAGAFTQGSSIELSCDGPIRPPYIAFIQGGLTYEYGKLRYIKSNINDLVKKVREGNFKMNKIIVIGGGPAGMLAAISASKIGNEVILIEKMNSCGKKLCITGKGRCNITNNTDLDGFIENTPSNAKFIYGAFSKFNNKDIIDLLEAEGVKTKVERGERVFPVSDKAQDVLDALIRILKRLNVKILTNTTVKRIIQKENSVTGVEISNNKILNADKVILATGGKSYPITGSTGDGYILAEQLGHTITKISPSLVPLTSNESICQELQGLSLKNVSIQLTDKEKIIYNDFGEMLFTHFGVSGPIILSSSSYLIRYKNINGLLNENSIKLKIDLKPALDNEKLNSRVLRDFQEVRNKEFKNSLDKLLPQKLIPVIIKKTKINEYKKVNEITKEERQRLVKLIKCLEININGVRPIEEAIITSGGVNVKEINPKTMESKIIKGLLFAGEIIDVDCLTGGFNLQVAWSTGFTAGMNCV